MTLSKNGRAAVFPPQVAPEQGSRIEETRTHLAMKADLGANDWREGCDSEVFEAIVFSEERRWLAGALRQGVAKAVEFVKGPAFPVVVIVVFIFSVGHDLPG